MIHRGAAFMSRHMSWGSSLNGCIPEGVTWIFLLLVISLGVYPQSI